jgi:hypothetical protein
MFNIRGILFSSHYMFRCIKVIIGYFYVLYMSLLIIKIGPFFACISNIII